jgi:hypothetical protein
MPGATPRGAVAAATGSLAASQVFCNRRACVPDRETNHPGATPLEDGSLPQRPVKPTTTTASPPPAGPGDPDLVAGGSGPELGGGEELLRVLRGIGAVMFLTSERLIVARDGFERRPRTGIQSFPLATISHLRLELGASPSGRIAVSTTAGQEVVSMFFDARSLDRAHAFMDLARPLIARTRRRGAGERPARPPSGPADSGSGGSA